jgi:hypothetical protein
MVNSRSAQFVPSSCQIRARSLARAHALRPELRERDAADVIHALMSPEVYRLLVGDRGWTPERYPRVARDDPRTATDLNLVAAPIGVGWHHALQGQVDLYTGFHRWHGLWVARSRGVGHRATSWLEVCDELELGRRLLRELLV